MTILSSPPEPAVTQPVGYSLPLSPSGASAMLTAPPWHFSGEIVMVEYRVDPDTARAFLPSGLDLGPDPGAAAAVFAQWQWCSTDGAELAEPERSQFGEFLILLGCAFDGRPMARAPYAWVDQSLPLVRGWVQGMPKQFGVVHQSRRTTVGQAGPRLAPGERFRGSLSVHGRRAAAVEVTLDGTVAEPPVLHAVPLAHTLTFPAWGRPAQPPALVASTVDGVEFGEIWSGAARFELFDGPDPDLARLRPVEIGAGYVFSYAETLVGGRLLDCRPSD